MKLLRHLVSFVCSFAAFAAALLTVLALLEEKKQSSYITIYDDPHV